MLNIGGWELMIILLVALVFLGPQRLPEVARQVGQTVNTLRGLARGFQAELEAAARPDPLEPAAADTPALPEPNFPTSQHEVGSGPRGTTPTNVDELAAKAREVNSGADESEIAPVSDGGPTDLVDEEE